MTNSKSFASVPSRVLGDCVVCGEEAMAYTGATTTDDGKYRCASCTNSLKVATKPVKTATRTSRQQLRRDFPEPPPVDGARWLQLGDNRLALVDAADFKRASVKNWFLFGGYAVRREQWGGKLRHDYLHRFVLGLDAEKGKKGQNVIEFIDDNPLNCRKSNLRVVSKKRESAKS